MKKKALLFIFIVFFHYHFLEAQTEVFANKLFQNIENQEYYKYYRTDGILFKIFKSNDVNNIKGFIEIEYYYGFADTCIISAPDDLKSEGLFYFELDEIDFKVLDKLDSVEANNYIERECTQLFIEKDNDKIMLYHIISSMQQYVIFREVDMDSISLPFKKFLEPLIQPVPIRRSVSR